MKCKVCGRNATGVHYGVMACEGCKAFYRRGVEKKITYLCYFGNKCTMRPNTRANCKSCRFLKCTTLGMRILGAKAKEDLSNSSDLHGKQAATRMKSITVADRKVPAAAKSSIKTNITAEFTIATQTDPIQELYMNSLDEDHSYDEEDIFYDIEILPDMIYTEDDKYDALFPVSQQDALVSTTQGWTQEYKFDETATHESRNLINFMSSYVNILDHNERQISMTVQSVSFATEIIFGDQLSYWRTCMDRALLHGGLINEPQISLETMLDSMHIHNEDLAHRVLKFATMLPGTAELDTSGKGSVAVGWKWMAFWLIHHASFLTDEDSYVTMGPQNHRYSRYWQNRISESPLLAFVYKFCGKFRDIGLNQTETYLLLAVVMFEPGLGQERKESTGGSRMSKLELIHRHYTDVLFDALKRRCSDGSQLTNICRKLEEFFGALRLVYRIHRHYLRALDLTQTPFRAVQGDHVVTVQEALCSKDNQDDPEEFDTRSPMTYKTRRASLQV